MKTRRVALGQPGGHVTALNVGPIHPSDAAFGVTWTDPTLCPYDACTFTIAHSGSEVIVSSEGETGGQVNVDVAAGRWFVCGDGACIGNLPPN